MDASSAPNVRDGIALEHGKEISKGDLHINRNPFETEIIYKDLVKSARQEIMLLLPSQKAFVRQEKMGIWQLLINMAIEKGVKVKVLIPTLSKELQDVLLRLNEQSVDIRQINAQEAATEEYRATIVIVDDKASLVIELKDDSKQTFAEAVGISIFSMNKVNVASYITLFRSFWEETELRDQLFSKTIQLEQANKTLSGMTQDLQMATSSVAVAETDLAVSEKKLATINEELVTAVKNLAALKKSSRKESEAKDAEIKIADDLLFESNQKLAAVNQKLLEVNKELTLANAQLKVNERMQRDFINIAAHELRTPLQPILGALDMLQAGEIERNEGLDMIARNARRAERLATDILNVARIENNSLGLDKANFDIHATVANAVHEQKLILEREGKGENLKILFEKTTKEGLSVYADEEKISEVMYNLLNNAVNHTSKGEILVTLETQDNKIIFKVIDSGSGIREDVQKRLFTKFATTSPKGMGLGLYISKNIIEAHGGGMWAENNANGRGATFAFSVPLNQVDKNEQR